ncbi:hypothetical protein B0H14DRAFT_2728652 [Mycena olivaceomarginata]|nr:hypothetical protein B0H14DRAFT_2728652 [Mycena olivaceomarginata]
MSRAHPPGCLCSNCHLSSKLFPRTKSDRIILPAIPGHHGHEHAPKSPTMGTDRARHAPPRPQSTAPDQYRPRHRQQEPPPPMPPMPHHGYGGPSSPSTSRHSSDQRAPPPMHRPVPTYSAQPPPDRGYAFSPPERPASAMAGPAPTSPSMQQQPQQGNLEWMPPRLKWVKKKERVSHFTPPSQFQGTSFRQYVHDGVSTRPNN